MDESTTEIESDLLEADLLALTLYSLGRTGKGRRAIRQQRIAYLLGFCLLGLGSWLLVQNPYVAAIFVAIGLLLFAIYPVYWGWMVRRRVSASYRDPRNGATFAARTLCAAESGLEERSSLGDMTVKWEAIDDFSEDSEHAFISVNGSASVVIPRGRITKGDYRAFADASRERIQQAHGGAGSAEGEVGE